MSSSASSKFSLDKSPVTNTILSRKLGISFFSRSNSYGSPLYKNIVYRYIVTYKYSATVSRSLGVINYYLWLTEVSNISFNRVAELLFFFGRINTYILEMSGQLRSNFSSKTFPRNPVAPELLYCNILMSRMWYIVICYIFVGVTTHHILYMYSWNFSEWNFA